MARKQVDISDLYKALSDRKGTRILCFDIAGLTQINEISHAAGDKAILTAAQRIEEVASQEMLLFRIGCDEFALVTGLRGAGEAERLAERVTARNGETFRWKDRNIPLSLWASSESMPLAPLRYGDLFTELQRTIDESKTPSWQS